jgi:CDP-glycerol glycerophosphotransferase (TagB/SpsB family)
MMQNAKKYFNLDNPNIIDGEGISYTEMFATGAILVTDYSSVQFDFSYLKKPVVYCQFDKAEFFSSHTCTEGYMDYERDGLGRVCNTLDSAVDTLCQYMDSGCELEEKYEKRIDSTFMFTDKGNCERTLKRILEIRNA